MTPTDYRPTPIAAGVAVQSYGLSLLLAELQALTQVMPPLQPYCAQKTEDEVDAAFDNMPV